MELRINLATASLKDAEHAIFAIGAYFGMTNLPTVAASYDNPKADGQPAPVDSDPTRTFGATPPVLPVDPAAVFAGNGATAPAGGVASPAVVPSAPLAAVPGADSLGNGAPTAMAPVGTPPAPQLAPAASAPQGVQLDAKGLPWDPRIHASGEGGTKPTNKDGTWRQRRGVQPLDVSKVEAELRQTMLAGTAAPMPPAPPAPPVAPPAPPVAPPAPPVAPPAPPAPPVAATVAALAPDPTTFEQLMPRVTAGIMAGKLPQDALLQAVTAYALPNIPALMQRPDLVPSVWLYLKAAHPDLV